MSSAASARSATSATGSEPRRGPRAAALRGVGDVVPMLAGYLPFALVVGVSVAAAGPIAARWISTVLVFGGSAQLVTLGLLDAGSPVALVIAAGLATNARLVAYSASLAPHWRAQPRWFRLLGAALLIDPTWALAQRDLPAADPRCHRAYYLGSATTLLAGWVVFVTIGTLAGPRLQDTVGSAGVLALAAPVSLAALVAPQVVGRPAIAVLSTAAGIGWLSAGWPAGTGLLLAVVAATGVGLLVSPGAEEAP